MGRIKTQLIKRTTNNLVRDHSEKLNTSFDDNKKAVDKLLKLQSPKLRNTIAGYATRQMRAKKD